VKLTARVLNGPLCRPDPRGRQRIIWDTTLPGFGVRIGKKARAFCYQRDLPGGRTRRMTIGRVEVWALEKARAKAREFAVAIDQGRDPNAEKRARAARGITLAEARDAHVARIRAQGGSERTIKGLVWETDRHLKAWLKRPLKELTRQEVRRRHEYLAEHHGPYTANRTMRMLRATYNTALREHDLPLPNPCIAVNWCKERRRQEPIPWDDLPAWLEKVNALSPVRRDYYLTLLYSGLRATDCATIRWADVDLKAATLFRPKPKGGRSFTIPLSRQLVAILERRKEENAMLFASHDGDDGWVFPTIVRRNGKTLVTHIVETKEQRPLRGPDGKVARDARGKLKKAPWLPSPHRHRDAYHTACAEAGLSGYDIDVLVNHRPATGSVTAGYIKQSLGHLAREQQRVSDFLEEKLNKKPEPAAEEG